MIKFNVPPYFEWTNTALCSTGDGFLYFNKRSINYICSSKNADDFPIVQHVWSSKCSPTAICVDPKWEDSHNCAVINDDWTVLVYNIKKELAVKGHNGHRDNPSQSGRRQSCLAICWTQSDNILSTENSTLIVYCTVSNRYTVYQRFFNKNLPTVLKPCQYDKNLVAAGCLNGSITIFSIETMSTLHHINVHDHEVTSLDWLYAEVEVKEETRKIIKARAKSSSSSTTNTEQQTRLAEVADDDPFDIYAVDENEVEFGTIVDKRPSEYYLKNEQSRHKIAEDFNFLEECQNLKENILGNENVEESETTFDGLEPDITSGEPKEYVDETRTPSIEELNLNEPLESAPSNSSSDKDDDKLKDFIVITGEGNINETISNVEIMPSKPMSKLVLVSAGKDLRIWFYNVMDGTPVNNFKIANQNKFYNSVSVLVMKKDKLLISTNEGDLIEYSIKSEEYNSQLRIKTSKIREFPIKKVITFCRLNNDNIWCFRKNHELICMSTLEDMEVIQNIETLTSCQIILENPLDPNIIAVGCSDRKIVIFNLSSFTARKAVFKTITPKINTRVTCLAWHPEKENILAFGTEQGRVGIIDTLKDISLIMNQKVFSEIYSVQWLVNDGKASLVCVTEGNCFYYVINVWEKSAPHQMNNLSNASHISVSNDGQYLYVGMSNGTVFVLDTRDNFEVRYTHTGLFNKYIGSMEAKDDILAVAGSSMIKLLNLSRFDGWQNNENVSVLGDHEKRVISLRWAKGSSKNLLSTGHDYAIKVWDTLTSTCISVCYLTSSCTSAIFSTLNENMIIAAGRDLSIFCYDYTEYSADTKPSKIKKSSIKWATTEIGDRLNKKHKEKTDIQQKKEAEPTDQILVNELENLALTESIEKPIKLRAPTSSVFLLSTRDLNTTDLIHQNILDMLEGNGSMLNSKLFGDADALTEFIETEKKHHMDSKSKSIANVFIPQIQHKFKEEVLERIADKSLTDCHVALAPFISYEFWRNCCQAYANQCLEKGETLTAITYLLSIHMVNEAIEFLCNNNYHKEAWIICKLRKDESDPIFGEIASQWTAYLETCGNFEGAATVWTGVKKYEKAIEILSKRREPSDCVLRAIEELKKQIPE